MNEMARNVFHLAREKFQSTAALIDMVVAIAAARFDAETRAATTRAAALAGGGVGQRPDGRARWHGSMRAVRDDWPPGALAMTHRRARTSRRAVARADDCQDQLRLQSLAFVPPHVSRVMIKNKLCQLKLTSQSKSYLEFEN